MILNRRTLGLVDTDSFITGTINDIDLSAVANSFGTGYDQQVASQNIMPILLILGLVAIFAVGKS